MKLSFIILLFLGPANSYSQPEMEEMSSHNFFKLLSRTYKAKHKDLQKSKRKQQMLLGIESDLSPDSGLCVGCENLPLAEDVLNILEKLQDDQPEEYHSIVEEISSYKAHFYLTKKLNELTFTPDKESTCPQGLSLLSENDKGFFSKQKVVLFNSAIPLEQVNQMQIYRNQGDYQMHVMKTNIKDQFIFVEMIKGQEPTISIVQMELYEFPKTPKYSDHHSNSELSSETDIKKHKNIKSWGTNINDEFGEKNKISLGFEIDFKDKDRFPRELRIFNMETSTETAFIDFKTQTVLSSRDQGAELELFKHGEKNSFAKVSVDLEGDYKLKIPMNFKVNDSFSVESTVSLMNKGRVEAALNFTSSNSHLFSLQMQRSDEEQRMSIKRNFEINERDRISFEMRTSSKEEQTGAWLRFERRF